MKGVIPIGILSPKLDIGSNHHLVLAKFICILTLSNHLTSSLKISHTGVRKLYYETRAVLSITKLQIYGKHKRKQVKVIILYKSVMDSNTSLFEPAKPKIGHS